MSHRKPVFTVEAEGFLILYRATQPTFILQQRTEGMGEFGFRSVLEGI